MNHAVISMHELLGEEPPKPQRPPRGPKPLKLTGRKYRTGQWRCIDRTKLIINKAGKEIQRSVHERMNYDASKKYPHSSLKQQTKEIKRRFWPVDYNFWELDDSEI